MMWSKDVNKVVMECYLKSKPVNENGVPIRRYRQRMFRVWCNGFAQVRIENLVPGLLHAQSKTPSKYRFTIVSLIVPVCSYSCGFRALIEAVN